jgi:hypothetical protein
MTIRPTMTDKKNTFEISQPIRLNGPKGWVLTNIKFNKFSSNKTYTYETTRFPRLLLEVTAIVKRSFFDEEKTKNPYFYSVNVKKKHGLNESLYTENFKKFSQVFSSKEFEKTLKFLESIEEKKEIPEDKTKYFPFGPPNDNEKDALEWFEHITEGYSVTWYSFYDAIVEWKDGQPEFRLEDGQNNMVLYKTNKKKNKLYIHFSKPIYNKHTP